MNRNAVKGVFALLTITLGLGWAGGTAERIALVAFWVVAGVFGWWRMRRSEMRKPGAPSNRALGL